MQSLQEQLSYLTFIADEGYKDQEYMLTEISKRSQKEDTQLQECPLEKSHNVGNFVQLAFAANKSQKPPMVHSANSPKRV